LYILIFDQTFILVTAWIEKSKKDIEG